MNDNDPDPKSADIAQLRATLAQLVVQIERGDPIDQDGHALVNSQTFHDAKDAAGEDALQAARSKPEPQVDMHPVEKAVGARFVPRSLCAGRSIGPGQPMTPSAVARRSQTPRSTTWKVIMARLSRDAVFA